MSSTTTTIDDGLGLVTDGLYSTVQPDLGSLVSPGSPLPTLPQLNPGESVSTSQLSASTLQLLQQSSPLSDATAISVSPSGAVSYNLSGTALTFGPSGNGFVNPALTSPNLISSSTATYSGSDILVMLEIPAAPWLKQLFELQTLSISTFRDKTPVRALGYIGAKGYARGSRTVAGTMVLTQFTADFLYQFIASVQKDQAVGANYTQVDQLPPFNLTIIFSDELGNASYQRLLGVDLKTTGTVLSVHDSMVEETISYVAADMTPVLPLSISSLLFPSDPSTNPSETAADLMSQSSKPGTWTPFSTTPSQGGLPGTPNGALNTVPLLGPSAPTVFMPNLVSA